MKENHLFILVLFLFMSVQIRATALSCDIIYIDGEEWYLMAKPLTFDHQLRDRIDDFLPENRCRTTADPMGYTVFWEVVDDYLYLLRIEACVYDKATKQDSTLVYSADDLKPIIGSYYQNGRICARWVSTEKDIAVGQGDMIWWSTALFYRNMEAERLLKIEQGKVTQSPTYHNYWREGMSLKEIQEIACRRFPWREYPEYRGHKLHFSMKDFQVDSIGRVVDFEVYMIRDNTAKQEIKDTTRYRSLAESYKEVLKAIYPWSIAYCNGKYFALQDRTSPLIRWNMTVFEKEDTLKHRVKNELDF